jgi:hypothetical protein
MVPDAARTAPTCSRTAPSSADTAAVSSIASWARPRRVFSVSAWSQKVPLILASRSACADRGGVDRHDQGQAHERTDARMAQRNGHRRKLISTAAATSSRGPEAAAELGRSSCPWLSRTDLSAILRLAGGHRSPASRR